MIYVIAPSIGGLIDLPWMSAGIFQPTHLAVCSAPSYNTPPCEAPMPFSIRPFRRFPVQGSVPDNAGPFLSLPLPYMFGFWLQIALLVLSSGPVYAKWVLVSGDDKAGLDDIA